MGGQLAEEEVARWYAGNSFSADWTTWHFSTWAELLRPLRDARVRVLEIGSWEGRSTLFFLNYLARSHVVCVDTFGGNIEHMRNPHFAALVGDTERDRPLYSVTANGSHWPVLNSRRVPFHVLSFLFPCPPAARRRDRL